MRLKLSYEWYLKQWSFNGIPVDEITLKVRDCVLIDITTYINGAPYAWSDAAEAATVGTLGLKKLNQFETPYLAMAQITGPLQGEMSFELNLNTAEATQLFSNTTAAVPCMIELQVEEYGKMISTAVLPVVLENDLNRGDEGPLSQANPDYPAATNILTKSGNLTGISDAQTARGVLDVYSKGEVDAAVSVKTQVGSTAPSDLGTSASAGSSSSAARADHVHRKPTLAELGAVSTSDARLSDARAPLAHDASLITSGTISLDRLPALATSVQVVASGDLTTLTAPQQAQIITGAIVTTSDGRRWLYKGSGSKTDSASYIEMGDITPEWTAIANKPSTFTPSAHTHPQSEVTNLVSDLAARALSSDVTTGLAGKANTVHTHATSDVTGLDTALANKRTILSGSGIPSSGLGSDGDLYIDTTGNKLYGPKASGAWGSGTFTQGAPGTGSTISVQSSSFTAAVGVRYMTSATLTITDPTGTSAGQSYEVIVGAGTTTLGGVTYTSSGNELIRYYNGTSWTTLRPVIFGNLKAGSVSTIAPSLMVQDMTTVALVSNALALPSDANIVQVTGTSPFSSITGGTIGARYLIQNKTGSSLTITHGASTLVCRGAANITLGVDQTCLLLCETSTKASVL